MSKQLNKKNNFVISLRNHLMSRYSTEAQHTFGEGDYEAKSIDGAYCLVRRDSEKPRDISGFCLRKDLCSRVPRSSSEIIEEIYDFSRRSKSLKSKLENKQKNLTILIGNKSYLITSHVGQGYSGEIVVNFIEDPCFSQRVA